MKQTWTPAVRAALAARPLQFTSSPPCPITVSDTMPRHPYFLTRCTGDVHPCRVVGLTCRSTGSAVSDKGVRVAEHLASWHAAGWASQRGKEPVLWEGHGETADSAWQAIDYAL